MTEILKYLVENWGKMELKWTKDIIPPDLICNEIFSVISVTYLTKITLY